MTETAVALRSAERKALLWFFAIGGGASAFGVIAHVARGDTWSLQTAWLLVWAIVMPILGLRLKRHIATPQQCTTIAGFIGVFFTLSREFVGLTTAPDAAVVLDELTRGAAVLPVTFLVLLHGLPTRTVVATTSLTLVAFLASPLMLFSLGWAPNPGPDAMTIWTVDYAFTLAMLIPIVGFFAAARGEVDDSQAREMQWAQAAFTDGLTGLLNRTGMDGLLAVPAPGAWSLLIADIDFFKTINDTHGHLTGDEVLRHVARTLEETARTDDVVARWGGEEFMIKLSTDDPEVLKAVGERMRLKIEELDLDGVRVTASFGGAVADDAMLPEEVIAAADAALYRAKQEGRNRVLLAA